MDNKLVVWVYYTPEGKEIIEKSIKSKLHYEFYITDRDLNSTDNGFKFLFDDETGGEIEISFVVERSNLGICISGTHAWEVVQLYELVQGMFFDEKEEV